MNKLTRIDSRTVVITNPDIDTDQIIPARFLTTTERKGLGQHLFSEWRYDEQGQKRPEFVLNTPAAENCEILVAGDNFGCGSSREHAPWALVDYGFKAIVSSSMADIFRSNALKNGLLPIVVEEALHERLLSEPGISVQIDLESCRLTLEDGVSAQFPIDGFSRYCLLNGIDELGFLLKQHEQVAEFEASRA